MCDFKDARPCRVPSGRLCGTDSFEHPTCYQEEGFEFVLPAHSCFLSLISGFLSLTYLKLSFLWA